MAQLQSSIEAAPLHGGATDVELLDSRDYYQELMQRIPHVRERAHMMAMAFWADGATEPLIESLADCAANTDANVSLAADSFSRLMYNHLPRWMLMGKMREASDGQWQRTKRLITRLEESGGQFKWLDTPSNLKKTLFFLNTNHIKATILDDTVYLGGANITGKDLSESIDFMVRVESPELADILELVLFEQEDIERSDFVLHSRNIGHIYFDSGKRNRSLIYETVNSLVAQAAEEVKLVTRFAPTGTLKRSLEQAQANGAEINCVYLRQKDISWLYKGLGRLGILQSRRLPARPQSDMSVEQYGPLHAKLLIADDKLVVSSHNFTGAGVLLGTKELAVITENTKLVAQAHEAFDTYFSEA